MRAEGFLIETVPPGGPQSASLAAGMAALRPYQLDRLVIALGDMPFLLPGDVSALLSLPADHPASAWGDGAPRPPAVFPSDWFGRLASLKGDRGAVAYLRDLPPRSRLELPSERLRDIDLRADLDR